MSNEMFTISRIKTKVYKCAFLYNHTACCEEHEQTVQMNNTMNNVMVPMKTEEIELEEKVVAVRWKPHYVPNGYLSGNEKEKNMCI